MARTKQQCRPCFPARCDDPQWTLPPPPHWTKVLEIRTPVPENQCCGSGMFILDPGSKFFHHGSRIKKIPDPDPHKRIQVFLTQYLFLMIWDHILDPGSELFFHPGSQIRIPDPGVENAQDHRSGSGCTRLLKTLRSTVTNDQLSMWHDRCRRCHELAICLALPLWSIKTSWYREVDRKCREILDSPSPLPGTWRQLSHFTHFIIYHSQKSLITNSLTGTQMCNKKIFRGAKILCQERDMMKLDFMYKLYIYPPSESV